MAIEDGKPYNDVILGIKMDINFPACNLTEQEVWEICQYVKYTWCRDLENKLNTQLEEAHRRETMWANNYAKLLKEVTDRMIELYNKSDGVTKQGERLSVN